MRAFRSLAASAAVLTLWALSISVLSGPAMGDSSSIAGAGAGGWTTPPTSALQDAPIAVTAPGGLPAAPPPPPAFTVAPEPVYATPGTPGFTSAPVAAPSQAAPAPCWSGCGMPCTDGVSMWYLTGVLGYAFYEGDDPAESCWYWGFDLGRTFCGCWGLDLFYRYHSGQLDRQNPPQPTKDGGEWHHVGVKFTYDFPISGKFYGWAGVGPEYWWTNEFLYDDDGFGVFAELGVGYVVNRSWRIRAGVNLHGMDTDVTRELPANDGQSRWLWVLAPVIEVEFAF